MMSTSMMAGIGEGAAGLFAMHAGFRNARKAREEAARLAKTRPQYEITPETQFEQSLAESELSKGMSSESEAAYNNAQERDIAGSIDAMLKTGSSGGNIADLFSASDQGRQRLSLMKDQLRLNQIGNVINSWRNMSGERDKKWQVNVDAPWKDAAQANAEAKKAAAALQMEGFKTFVKSQSTFAGNSQPMQSSEYLSNGGGYNGPQQANFSQGSNISGQTTNSPYMNSIGGGSQGWYSGSGNFSMPSSGGGFGGGGSDMGGGMGGF